MTKEEKEEKIRLARERRAAREAAAAGAPEESDAGAGAPVKSDAAGAPAEPVESAAPVEGDTDDAADDNKSVAQQIIDADKKQRAETQQSRKKLQEALGQADDQYGEAREQAIEDILRDVGEASGPLPVPAYDPSAYVPPPIVDSEDTTQQPVEPPTPPAEEQSAPRYSPPVKTAVDFQEKQEEERQATLDRIQEEGFEVAEEQEQPDLDEGARLLTKPGEVIGSVEGKTQGSLEVVIAPERLSAMEEAAQLPDTETVEDTLEELARQGREAPQGLSDFTVDDILATGIYEVRQNENPLSPGGNIRSESRADVVALYDNRFNETKYSDEPFVPPEELVVYDTSIYDKRVWMDRARQVGKLDSEQLFFEYLAAKSVALGVPVPYVFSQSATVVKDGQPVDPLQEVTQGENWRAITAINEANKKANIARRNELQTPGVETTYSLQGMILAEDETVSPRFRGWFNWIIGVPDWQVYGEGDAAVAVLQQGNRSRTGDISFRQEKLRENDDRLRELGQQRQDAWVAMGGQFLALADVTTDPERQAELRLTGRVVQSKQGQELVTDRYGNRIPAVGTLPWELNPDEYQSFWSNILITGLAPLAWPVAYGGDPDKLSQQTIRDPDFGLLDRPMRRSELESLELPDGTVINALALMNQFSNASKEIEQIQRGLEDDFRQHRLETIDRNRRIMNKKFDAEKGVYEQELDPEGGDSSTVYASQSILIEMDADGRAVEPSVSSYGLWQEQTGITAKQTEDFLRAFVGETTTDPFSPGEDREESYLERVKKAGRRAGLNEAQAIQVATALEIEKQFVEETFITSVDDGETTESVAITSLDRESQTLSNIAKLNKEIKEKQDLLSTLENPAAPEEGARRRDVQRDESDRLKKISELRADLNGLKQELSAYETDLKRIEKQAAQAKELGVDRLALPESDEPSQLLTNQIAERVILKANLAERQKRLKEKDLKTEDLKAERDSVRKEQKNLVNSIVAEKGNPVLVIQVGSEDSVKRDEAVVRRYRFSLKGVPVSEEAAMQTSRLSPLEAMAKVSGTSEEYVLNFLQNRGYVYVESAGVFIEKEDAANLELLKSFSDYISVVEQEIKDSRFKNRGSRRGQSLRQALRRRTPVIIEPADFEEPTDESVQQ